MASIGGSEIVEDRTLDEDSVSCPSEIGEQLVDGFASIEYPNGMTALALSIASTGLSMVIETARVTGPTPVLNVTGEVHADHLQAVAHHPPTP